jgi:hypothetical protein
MGVFEKALALEMAPDQWLVGDDKCDCTFQRIGEWGNPYIGKSLQVRLCCIWDELAKDYPQFVQEVDGYWDRNRIEPVMGAQPWDSEEMDMPLDIWYRQLASEQNRPLVEIREEYRFKQHLRPRKVPAGQGRETYQPNKWEVRRALLYRLEKTGWRREDAIANFERLDAEERARDAQARH